MAVIGPKRSVAFLSIRMFHDSLSPKAPTRRRYFLFPKTTIPNRASVLAPILFTPTYRFISAHIPQLDYDLPYSWYQI